MTRYRDFDPGDVLPSTWTDAIEDLITTFASGYLKLTAPSSTTVRIEASSGLESTLAIGGKPRWISSNVTATHPGGAAAVSNVYVISTIDSFAADGDGNESDTTNHAFGLKIGTPSGSGSEALSRKIGEVDWSGTAITGIRQLFGANNTQVVHAIAPIPGVPPVVAKGAASQTAPLYKGIDSAGAQKFEVEADGTVDSKVGYKVDNVALASTHLSDSASLVRFTDVSGAYQPADSDLSAIAALATTAYGRSLLTTVDASALRTALGAQPLDSDLTALAALSTTSYGRALLEAADAAALLSSTGILLAGAYSSRPTATSSINGVRYFATDKAMEWVCVSAAWALVNANAPEATSLPGSPVDQQECVYTADAANGVKWHLKYDAELTGSYKWVVIGGAPLSAVVDTSEGHSTTSYAALSTAGPSITVPLAGDYDVTVQSLMGSLAGVALYHSYDVGGTGALDADAASTGLSGAQNALLNSTRRKTSIAASTAIVSKYKVSSGTGTWIYRTLMARPVRVG